jgi:hypothetical protein
MGSPILAPERRESHRDSPGALCRGSDARCVGRHFWYYDFADRKKTKGISRLVFFA